MTDLSESPSPFMRLPPELRLIIYEMLFIHPAQAPIDKDNPIRALKALSTAPDYHDYEQLDSLSDALTTPSMTLKIRTEDPMSFEQRQPSGEVRTRFLIRSDRFRARCMWTTYHLNCSSPDLSTRLLLANTRIHAECAQLLYSSYTFDFDTHIEAVVPFLAGGCLQAGQNKTRKRADQPSFCRSNTFR